MKKQSREQIKEQKREQVYGYVRVSSREQNEDRQLLAMREAGIPKNRIYVDKLSGKDFERPQYKQLMKRLGKDTVLYVKSIDRLGRNYEEIIEQWRTITKEIGADIVVLDMPLLDTRRGKDLMGTFLSDIVLQLLSFVAENERSNIRQRQAEGIVAARQRGVQFGRPKIELPENFDDIVRKWQKREISLNQVCRVLGLPKSTAYDRLVGYLSEVDGPDWVRGNV